jgi:hypothetical protein
MGIIHTYVIFCMTLNPTMCLRYEIVKKDTFETATSQMDCMMGGAIFAAQHATLVIAGVDYQTKGGVRCEADPPRVGAVEEWVEKRKAFIARTEPQIK